MLNKKVSGCHLVDSNITFFSFYSFQMVRIFCIAICTLVLVIQNAFAQSSNSLLPHIPTSPQAESFARFGDLAINTSTGTPDISIPLIQIDHHGYRIPVTLKYNPQPLKAGYNYDVLGHGWGLSMNSCISRSIEYQPDELNDFELKVPSDDYLNNCGNCLTNGNYAHDKFRATLPDGSSFDFVIDKLNGVKRIFLSEDRNVKIDYAVSGSQIIYFTLIDENGVKYKFDGADTPFPSSITYYNNYVSWQLSRIDLPNSPEPILFNYSYLMTSSRYTSCTESIIQFKHYHTPGIPNVDHHIYDAQKFTEGVATAYNMRLLESISYGAGGKSRLQLYYKNPSGSEFNYVTTIRHTENAKLIKKIQFNMDVLNINSLCSTPLVRLDSISISGSGEQLHRYRFNYASRPSGFSGTDHWGNMNNSSYSDMPNFTLFTEWHNNTTTEHQYVGMIERPKTPYDLTPFRKFSLSNETSQDSKRPSFPSNHGIIQRITYPTGGYSIFEFENHHFYSHTSSNGDYIHERSNREIREGGGFRIKTIENYSASGKLADKKVFKYGKTYGDIGRLLEPNTHTGAGEPVVDPNIRTYMNFSSYMVNFPIENMILGLNQSGKHLAFSNPFVGPSYDDRSWYWLCNFSPLNFRRLLNGRNAVLYDKVTIYEGDIDEVNDIYPLGKTVYEYDLKGYYPGEYFFEQPQYFGNMLGYIAMDFKYNKLIHKTKYRYDSTNSKFVKVNKETNTWSWQYNSLHDYQFRNTYPEQNRPSWITVGSLFVGKPFHIGSGKLRSKQVIDYFSTDSIAIFESYIYNNIGQLVTTTTRKNVDIETKYKYPVEYANAQTTPPVISAMLNRNILSPVLSTVLSMPESTQREYEQQSGLTVEYGDFGSGKLLPSKIYQLEFGPEDSKYVLREEVTNYSVNGYPLEIIERGKPVRSYIRGYEDRYTIAEVQNALFSDIAFTGFESSDQGNWTYLGPINSSSAYTGEKCYSLTSANPLSKTGLNASKTYVLTLMVKGTGIPVISGGSEISRTSSSLANGWIQQRYVFQNATSISLNNSTSTGILIDDVRLHPVNSKMSTYTHEPLIGMTSTTNSRGVTEYYEYDSLGRLIVIKDFQGNILKSYDYNYSQ